MYERHLTGQKGEELATKYLLDNNYKIIERNFESISGEIDIIAFDNKKQELVFIEVKTRTNKQYGNPADAVDRKKQKHIYKSANYYLYMHDLIDKIYVRLDVIEVYLTNNLYKINHIKQII